MPLDAHQVAVILQRAAHTRRDVKRARINVAEDDHTTLLVSIEFYTPGRRVQREARLDRCLDGRTCGAILEDWLGPMPTSGADEAEAVRANRYRFLEHTPEQVAEMLQQRRSAPAPRAPASSLDWPRQPAELEGNLPQVPEDATPAGQPAPRRDDRYWYTGPGGARMPKLTRQQMIDAGLTREQRHEQYRSQGGKHPDDAPS